MKAADKTVIVLLSTYNGGEYLRDQINSLVAQKNVDLRIIVRDDGSTDETISILEEYRERGALDFYTGENLKPARSFMYLLSHAPKADYYAFCDQDDVWDQYKLAYAIESLEGTDGPALYYHAMNIVDQDLNSIGYYFRKTQYSQSVLNSCLYGDEIAGCTMVWNIALANRIKEYSPTYLTMHDGWIHRVCLAVGGTVIGDPTAYILYRQHGYNAVGMENRDVKDQLAAFLGRENRFSRLAAEMIDAYADDLQEDDKEFLQRLSSYRDNAISRIYLMKYVHGSCGTMQEKTKLVMKILLGAL